MLALASLPLLASLIGPTQLSSAFPLPQVETIEIWSHSRATLDLDAGCCVNVTKLMVMARVSAGSLVRCFPNLKDLGYYAVHGDARPLGELLKLRRLSLHVRSSQRGGMTFLLGLVNMQHLDVGPINDLSVLRNMKKLRSLAPRFLKLEAVTSLLEFPRLSELDITVSRVRDVACLRGHPSLTKVRLPHNMSERELMVNGNYALPSLKELWVGSKMVWPPG